MLTIYIDADACPVKDEAYRVAARYSLPVLVVANSQIGIPVDPLISMVVRTGFGAAGSTGVEPAVSVAMPFVS